MKPETNDAHASGMGAPALALVGSVLYATLRYQVLKGVPWSDWPAYTLNKAFGLAAILLLAFSVIRQSSARACPRDQSLPMAGAFAALHVLLSLVLLSPARYENFFRGNQLTAAAGGSMLLGAIAAVLMGFGWRPRSAPGAGRSPGNLPLLCLVVGCHAMLPGFPGWFTPSQWPGGLPPITLLSFLSSLAAVGIAIARKRPA